MILIFLMTIFFIFLDQISKYFILNNMKIGESISIINNFFSITSHRNRGAAWGILEDSILFFIIVTTIFLIAIILYLLKKRKEITNFDKIVFSLILGGAIGNFIDRIKIGAVVDFLDFNLFGYNFPIFNFADIFICFGVSLLLIKIYKEN